MLELILTMKALFQSDIRYDSILADVYFTHRKYRDAERSYKALVLAERGTHNDGHLKHRAFCRWCWKQIIGIRVKCVNPICSEYDWCGPCFRVQGPSHDTTILIPPDMEDGIILWAGRVDGVVHPPVIINARNHKDRPTEV